MLATLLYMLFVRERSAQPRTMALQPARALKSHRGFIRTVAQAGAHDSIITASGDGTVRLWNTMDGRCVRIYRDTVNRVNDVAVVDDNTALTVGGPTVRVVRISDGMVLARRSSFAHFLWSCAVLGSASAVVGDSFGNVIRIAWNRRRVNVQKRVKRGHAGSVIRIYANEDKFATCSTDNTAKLWDGKTMKAIQTFHGHMSEVVSVVFDKNYLACGALDSSIRIYDVVSGAHITTIRTHTGSVWFLSLCRETSTLVSGGSDRVIATHTLPAGKCARNWHCGVKITAGAVLESGTIAVAGYKPFDVSLFDGDIIWSPHNLGLPQIAAEQLTCDDELACDTQACCICLHPFRPRERVFGMPCLHVHHTQCLRPALKQAANPQCPVCRTPVHPLDIERLPSWEWSWRSYMRHAHFCNVSCAETNRFVLMLVLIPWWDSPDSPVCVSPMCWISGAKSQAHQNQGWCIGEIMLQRSCHSSERLIGKVWP